MEHSTIENKYWDVTQKWVDLVSIYFEKSHSELCTQQSYSSEGYYLLSQVNQPFLYYFENHQKIVLGTSLLNQLQRS